MPIITQIKRQKRADARYSVYVDDAYVFGLSDLELSNSGLRVGQELTVVEVEQHRQAADQAKVYALALRYIGVRPRSQHEVVDYLARKGHEGGEIDAVVARLKAARVLDDQMFADSWIVSRQLLRPRSRRRLEQELLAKGVGRDDIAVALGELGDDSELASLVEVIEKKRRLPQYQQSDKLMGYLARQGYAYDLIKKALRRLDEQI